MKTMINEEHIEGKLYSHELVKKTVQNKASENFGKEFISGDLNIVTDENMLNVITVHFTYVTPKTKKGADNRTFKELNTIIEKGVPAIERGWADATAVKVDNTTLTLNDFYSSAKDEMVSVKRNEGGFVSIVSNITEDKAARQRFKCDMLITSVKVKEADEEKNTDEYVIVNGYIFNFGNKILPVDFVVRNEQGIKYFEGLEVSNKEPLFTTVWGKIVSSTILEQKKEESGFGEALVTTVERKSKEWVITGISPDGYDFGDESVLTADDVTKALQNREIDLAEIKKRNDEYQAAKAAAPSANGFSNVAVTTNKKSDFNF